MNFSGIPEVPPCSSPWNNRDSESEASSHAWLYSLQVSKQRKVKASLRVVNVSAGEKIDK